MKPLTVTYERLFNLGNYNNERISIELALDDGDTAQSTLEAAKRWVLRNGPSDPHEKYQLEQAQHILDDPDNYTGRQLNEAKQLLEQHAIQASSPPDIPF